MGQGVYGHWWSYFNYVTHREFSNLEDSHLKPGKVLEIGVN